MTTKTTFHLSISRPAMAVARLRATLAQRDPIALMATVVCCLIVVATVARRLVLAGPAPMAAVATAPQPITIIQTARAVAIPTALPTQAPHLVVAFDSPNGTAFPDPIPEPAPAAWIGRWGDGWIEVQWSPNPIWIRAADIGANLADVRPVPQVQIAPAPAAAPNPAEPQYHVSSAPEQAPPADWAASNRASDDEITRTTDAWIAAGQAILDSQSPEVRNAQPLTLDQMPCNCPDAR